MSRPHGNSSDFTLYTTTLSANGRKPLALVYHLGLNPQIEHVNVYAGEGQRPEYLAINPFGKVPTLVVGDFVLWESNALLQYIAEVHGKALWSQDAKARADMARWLFWESAHWQPAISAVLAEVVGHRLLPEIIPAPKASPQWQDPTLLALLNYLNRHLAQHEFLSGNALSIADFSVAGMMTYFPFASFPFEDFPHLARWYRSMESLEAWRRSSDPLWEKK